MQAESYAMMMANILKFDDAGEIGLRFQGASPLGVNGGGKRVERDPGVVSKSSEMGNVESKFKQYD